MTIPRINNSDYCDETIAWSNAYLGVNSKYPVMDIEERLREVEKWLLIVAPSLEATAKYPALARAYQEYKIIERLTLGNDGT